MAIILSHTSYINPSKTHRSILRRSISFFSFRRVTSSSRCTPSALTIDRHDSATAPSASALPTRSGSAADAGPWEEDDDGGGIVALAAYGGGCGEGEWGN